MQLRLELKGDYEVMFETLMAQLQISGGTKTERNKKLIELSMSCLEQVIEQEQVKTGKRFPSYDDVKKAVTKGQFERN